MDMIPKFASFAIYSDFILHQAMHLNFY